ncbi:MAG: sulfatase-like hydrolase/transferase, partial [Verrucomicrobiota bacterium]|nr:sulfatase-like hydrolase/transferase [Verrucomicrobiota bacterium]
MVNRNSIVKIIATGIAALALCAADAAPQKVRNIVFVLADDLGIKDLGCYGSDYYETPNLDRFATEGMQFVNAYSAHPVCSPTRASILTGRYPARLHLTAYIPGQECPKAKLSHPKDWIKYLRNSEVTYGEAFQEEGFATCHIGKWHVGTKGAENHGFDVVTGARHDHKNSQGDPWFVDCYTRAAEKFMEANRDRPFLVTLSHGTVHVPLYEKEELISKYRKKAPGSNGQNNPVYAAMVERMDWSVGRVLAKLEELGLEKNTAVVFFSDNGGLGNVYDKDLKKSVTATSNLPYRGGKSILNEGGIRVPLLIRWPGVTKPGSTCETPVISTDLYPTFLEMAGLPLQPQQHLDGLSLASLLQGAAGLDRGNLYWHYPHYQSKPPHGAVRSGDWKLIEHYEDGRLELFNVTEDISESRNLASSYPERAEQLRKLLHNHLKTIGAQMPEPNPGHDPSVFWRTGGGNGKYDPYESKQDEDPRTYVTDPNLDYGAGGDRREVQAEPYTPVSDLLADTGVIAIDTNLPNVLLIGDSISIAYTPMVREILEGKANVFRPHDLKKNRPINCGSTDVGLKGLDGWLKGRTWDVIHFNWGLHDLCYRNPKVTHIYGSRDKVDGKISVPISRYKKNMEQLVRRLEQTDAVLVWASTTRVPAGEAGRIEGDAVRYNAAAAAIMERHGIRIDDLYSMTKEFSKEEALVAGDV